MKKSLKISLIILGVLVGIIILDTIQALVFNNNAIIGIETKGMVRHGILVNTYHCGNGKNITRFRLSNYIGESVCGKNINYIITDVDNVSIRISDISLTGATITIKDTNETPYVYGEWYKIQKQVNGVWEDLETLIDNYEFNDIGYEVDNNKEVKFVIDWKWLYGELQLGSYRILKQVDNKYISIEFNIATTSNSKEEVIKPNLFDRNEIIKVTIDNYSQYKNNFEYSDKDTIDTIYNLFKNLETNVESKSSEPENPEELYKVIFFNSENMLIESDNDIFKSTVYVYKKGNKYYAEETKNGIYEITEKTFNTIKNYTK